MPRSAPGAVTAAPSSVTRPVVGRSRPATMRSSVDLPQPEGPSRQMKSLSATASDVGSRARVGGAPRTPANVRLTSSRTSRDTQERSGEATGEQPLVHRLAQIGGHVAGGPDDPDGEEDLGRV